MAKRKRSPKVGRPLFDGKNYDSVIQKLSEVWALDGSDAEAALFADISPAALCEFLKAHPDISERKAALKQTPFLIARRTLVEGVKTDPDLALKYMERKCRAEFATRSETEISGALSLEQLIAGSNDKPKK